jgi:hypothetical protein
MKQAAQDVSVVEPAKEPRILVVEDEPLVAIEIAEVLRKAGCPATISARVRCRSSIFQAAAARGVC